MQPRPTLLRGLVWAAPVSAALLLAADPAWRSQPIESWTEEDARQVLTESPWAKSTQADVNRLQTEDQRRESGNMGEATGVGYDGLAKDRLPIPKNIIGLFLHAPAPRPLPQIGLQVLWESAFPFRAAELKAGVRIPTLEGDGYKIAVYGIPATNAKGDPKSLGKFLNLQAFLKRPGKKDVRALRCEVFRQEDAMVAVYLFPLSAEITAKDGLLEFDARIGRISIVQFFNVGEMGFQENWTSKSGLLTLKGRLNSQVPGEVPLFKIQGNRKSCLQTLGALLVGGVLLLAADPAWKTKPVPSWTQTDTKQILSDSPWAKVVKATIVRKQSEDERRAGGNMGDAKGIGYDGLQKEKVIIPKSILDLMKPEPRAPPRPQLPVLVRWESALAVRMAEFKAGTFDPPTLEGDGYKVAVYGIPTANVKGDPKVLGEPLKDNAFLRREGQKDVKPLSVEVFQQEDSMVAVYLFPLSAEINKKDPYVEFGALIGRIAVTQNFTMQDMQFQGKLDL